MSEQSRAGIYVYQPFGIQHPDKWKSGRIYGIGGLPMEATCHGLTKQEAEAVLDALLRQSSSVPTAQREEQKDGAGDGSILVERYHVCVCADPRPLVPGATCRRCHKPVSIEDTE